MKYLTQETIDALEKAIEMRRIGKSPAEIADALRMKNASSASVLMTILKRNGANIGSATRGGSFGSRVDMKEVWRIYRAHKAVMASRPS